MVKKIGYMLIRRADNRSDIHYSPDEIEVYLANNVPIAQGNKWSFATRADNITHIGLMRPTGNILVKEGGDKESLQIAEYLILKYYL
jgi:hypothetical protein